MSVAFHGGHLTAALRRRPFHVTHSRYPFFVSYSTNLQRPSRPRVENSSQDAQHLDSTNNPVIARWKEQLGTIHHSLSNQSGITISHFRDRTSELNSRIVGRLRDLGGRINEFTGYRDIELLKFKVVEREQRIKRLRDEAREVKAAYERAALERASCQRQVNDLLQRKSTWTDNDVSTFTALVRQDHINEQAVVRLKAEALQAEDQVENEFNELMKAILSRYHEEQVWSDKIRSASTYGSLAALGLNLVVFILAIVFVEPWKRKRLAQTFESRVEQLSTENRALIENGLNDLSKRFTEQGDILEKLAIATSFVSPTDILLSTSPNLEEPPSSSINVADELKTWSFSERDVFVGLVGAAGGTMLAFTLSLLWK